MALLLTAPDLHELLNGERPPIVLDVRWRLDRPDGRADFAAGHIPTAVYVDLDRELARHGDPADGRHPLPELDDLQRAARSWGIDDGDTVVVYDDLGNLSAARAWWLLTWAGLADVRLLDGGLAAWSAERALETGPAHPRPGGVHLEAGHLPTITLDEAGAWPDGGVLLDARAPERYRGEVEPIDPRAGHIPGALSAPTAGNTASDGRFLEPEALRVRFAELGVTEGSEVAVYCGSGVTASHEIVALTLAGFRPALYPGSWSQWSNHADRPVATGA
ncbi:MAG: sulfurtransferase [Herbiconiux sp.]|nr:sulfurtransferase [Herbiconiux sp.]